MAKEKIICDFTEGNIPGHMVKFMLPFMAANALQILYSLVDMLIVGRYVGSAGLSAVGQGGLVVGFATMVCMGFSNSGLTIVSQLLGAGKRDELQTAIGTLLSAMALMGLFMGALVSALREYFTALLHVQPEAREMCAEYMLICGFGLFFISGYNSAAALLRGMGDSRHPFIIITLSSVINLSLDWLFVGVLGSGVRGAALATVISQVFLFLCVYGFLIRHKAHFYFDFRPRSFCISGRYLPEMLRLGVPLALQACAITVSMMLCNSYINAIGISESATFGVGVKVDDLFNKVVLGIQYAAAPMVGQNFGAGKTDRVKKTICWTWLFSGGICVVFLFCYVNFGPSLFGLFSRDGDVRALAPVFISAAVWTFPAMAAMRGTNALLQGIGNSRLIMLLSFCDSGLRVLGSYLLGVSADLGFFGFTLGFMLAPYGVAVPGTVYFIIGKWKRLAPVGKSAASQ